MPALAERTKIKSDWGSSATIKGLVTHDMIQGACIGWVEDLPVDIYAYGLVSGSTRVAVLPYLQEPSAKAKELLKKLYAYGKLPNNWDGSGAVAPEEIIIAKVASFINFTDEFDMPFYFIAPGPNGEIVLEYKQDEKMAEVFFNEDDSEELILYHGNEQVYFGEIDAKLLRRHFTH